MAVVYRDDSEVNNQFNTTESLFFALEPIGMRLFGHIDRPFQAVQGGQVAFGTLAVTAWYSPLAT